MDYEKTERVLESIGFSKNEIKVYLDLIKQDSSTALELAKRTGIHRSNTYDILRSLMTKGFIREMTVGGKRVFRALHPERIRNYLNQKKQEFEEVLPELEKYSKKEDVLNKSWISEGTFAAREALMDLLKMKESIMVFGASVTYAGGLGKGFLEEFHRERIKNKIVMKRVFTQGTERDNKHYTKLKHTEARYLPDRFESHMSTVICGGTTLFLIFGKPTLVITIKNKDVADSYRKYFKIIWNASKKVTEK